MNICTYFLLSYLLINCFKSRYYGEICQIDSRNFRSDNQNLKNLKSNKRKMKKLSKTLRRNPWDRIKLSLKNLGEKKALTRQP